MMMTFTATPVRLPPPFTHLCELPVSAHLSSGATADWPAADEPRAPRRVRPHLPAPHWPPPPPHSVRLHPPARRGRPRSTPDWTSRRAGSVWCAPAARRRGSQARAPVLRGPPGATRPQPLDWIRKRTPVAAERCAAAALVAGICRWISPHPVHCR